MATPTKINIFSDGSYQVGEQPSEPQIINTYTIPPSGGPDWQHLHDYDTDQFDWKQRSQFLNYKKDPPDNALPDVFWLKGSDPGQFTFLSEADQWFWFDLMVLSVGGSWSHARMIEAWKSTVQESRGMTDGHSPELGFKDYVTGRNINNPSAQDMAIFNGTCGGNWLWQKSRLGKKVYFHTMVACELPPAKDIWGDWRFVHFATESCWVKFPDKSYKVSRWPQLEPYGTPFPFISVDGELWTTIDRVRPLSPGETCSWYNPPTA